MKDRGTLTLLSDGRAVVGLPDTFTPEEAQEIAKFVKEWLADPARILVVPYPLDVVDLRRKAADPFEDRANGERAEWVAEK